jgi:hypothetical protein
MSNYKFILPSVRVKASLHSGKLSVDWNGEENFFVLKSLVPTQSSQDKEKFSCPFQSTDNFPQWKLAFRMVQMTTEQRVFVVTTYGVNAKCNRCVKLFGRREVVNTSAVHVQLN